MTEVGSTQGFWKARIHERIRELGYDSLTAFAEARPTVSLVELAEEFGKDDISAVQLLSVLVAEAERNHQMTRLVRGQLVRELSESLPDGWPPVMNDVNRFEVAQALAFWFGFIPETHKQRAEQVMAALRSAPPPPGWRPLGPDDELLRTLMPDEEV